MNDDIEDDETITDDQMVQTLLNRGGFTKSGDYDPAYPSGPGRWSVDLATLALLLIASEQRDAAYRQVTNLRYCLIKAGVKEGLVDQIIRDS